jgi:hypothetical protein
MLCWLPHSKPLLLVLPAAMPTHCASLLLLLLL